MSSRFIRNIIVLVISIGIIVAYIQPEFARIKEVQQEVDQYEEAVARATDFNNQLTQLLQQVESIPTTDIEALEEFLPTEVDLVSVARDVEQYARQSSLSISGLDLGEDLSQEPVQAVQRQVETGAVTDDASAERAAQNRFNESVVTSQLEVRMDGTYQNFNRFLTLIESNRYPLQIVGLQVTSAGGDEESVDSGTSNPPLAYTLTLQVYGSPLAALTE